MEFKIRFFDSDIDKVKRLILESENKPIFKERLLKNIKKKNLRLGKENFWNALLKCQLTSQQRSSPNSPGSIYYRERKDEFEVNKSIELLNNGVFEQEIADSLKKFRGIRFYNNIAFRLNFNLKYLQNSNWKILFEIKNQLSIENSTKEDERHYSRILIENFKGLGPKQSRNFLQMLGLSKFEIPIDSRFVKWLNDNFKYPYKLSSVALSCNEVYEFVLDTIQELCANSKTVPCLLDAAVFTQFDNGLEWAKEDEV